MEQTNFLKINKPSNGKDFVIDDKFWKENPDKIDEQFRLVDAQLAENTSQITDLSNALMSVNWFGSIGDGQSHPLSTKYSTLAEAQAVFPFATALTNEIDWCALQKALNNGSNIAVYGDLVIDQAVTSIKGSVKLFGHGSISLTNKNDDIFRVDRNGLSTLENFEVSGLTFIGNADKADATPQRGIYFYNTNKINIHDCTFKNLNIAIRLTNSNDFHVHDNQFYDLVETSDNINGYGLLLEGCTHQSITDNQFYRVERHSIYLNNYEAAVVSGNLFKGDPSYVAVSGYELPVKLTVGHGCSITGNTFKDTVGGIWLDTSFGGYTTGPENVTITGNTFEDYRQNDSIVTGWIYFLGMYMKNIKVSNNIFKNAYNHALYYAGSGDVEISDNIIDGGNNGIRIETTSTNARLTISRNRLLNLTSGIVCTNTNPKIYGEKNGFKGVTTIATYSSNPNNMIIVDNYSIDTPDTVFVSGATPNVNLGKVFGINNGSATNMTGFSGGSKDQVIVVYFANGNTVLKHNPALLFLKAQVDVTSYTGMTKSFVQANYGTWYEVG